MACPPPVGGVNIWKRGGGMHVLKTTQCLEDRELDLGLALPPLLARMGKLASGSQPHIGSL